MPTTKATAPAGANDNTRAELLTAAALKSKFERFRTIPLWPVGPDGRCTCGESGCRRPGKHPARNAPGPGHVVETGAETGVFVLDIDVKGGKDGYGELEALGGVPDTFAVRTGSGGAHFYFRHPGFPVRNRKPSPGIDIKGDPDRADGLVYVVGPGSPGYVQTDDPCVVAPSDPYEVVLDAPIADAPDWLLAWLRIGDTRKEGFAPEPIDTSTDEGQRRIRLGVEACKTFPPSMADGEGGKRLFALCIRLVRKLELPLDVAAELIEEHFCPRCTQPDGVTPFPWSPEDIEHKLLDARDRSDVVPGILWEATQQGIKELAARRTKEAVQARKIELERSAIIDRAKELAESNADAEEDGTTQIAWTFERGDSVEIAEKLSAIFPRLVFSEGNFHLYDRRRGVWTSDGTEAKLRRLVRSMAGADVGDSGAQLKLNAPAIGYAIQTLSDVVRDDRFFESAPTGLACPNGFLRLVGVEAVLVPHAEEHRARIAYPIAYEPHATSPTWDQFLEDLFVDDFDRDSKKRFLGEFFGACLFGVATRYQRCVVAYGAGENGKSKLLDIVSQLFPEGSVAAFSPHNLENEYWRAKLPSALLNRVAEMPAAPILASENFKAVVTGDEVDARSPGCAPFTFRPRAGHFFGANRLPGTTDQSRGFWRRFVVVGFNRDFSAGGGDPLIAEKVLEGSKEAVFAWLVSGALRLLERGHYDVPPSHEQLLQTWRKNSDSVATWLDERAVPQETPTSQSSTLYQDYKSWALDNTYKPVAANTFGERLKASGYPREGKHKMVRLSVPTPLLARTFGPRSA